MTTHRHARFGDRFPCAFGLECKNPHNDRPVADGANPPAICPACEAHYRRVLGLLVYDYVDLSQQLGESGASSEAKIARPKPQSRPPINLHAHTVRSAIADTLRFWETCTVVQLGHTQPDPRVREGFAVRRAAGYLARHLHALSMLDIEPDTGAGIEVGATPNEAAGVAALAQLEHLHEAARRVCGLTAKKISVPGHCPGCASATLTRVDGSDTVRCGRCGQVQTLDDYWRTVSLIVHENPTDA